MFDHFYKAYTLHRKQFTPLYRLVPTPYLILFICFGIGTLAASIYTIYRFSLLSSALVIICILGIVVVDFRTERIIKQIVAQEHEDDKAFIAQYLKQHHITSYTQITLFVKNLDSLSNTTSKRLNLIPYIAALVSIFIYIADDADEIEPVIIWVSIVLILLDPLYNFIYNMLFDRKYKRFYELARKVEEVYIEGLLTTGNGIKKP